MGFFGGSGSIGSKLGVGFIMGNNFMHDRLLRSRCNGSVPIEVAVYYFGLPRFGYLLMWWKCCMCIPVVPIWEGGRGCQ